MFWLKTLYFTLSFYYFHDFRDFRPPGPPRRLEEPPRRPQEPPRSRPGVWQGGSPVSLNCFASLRKKLTAGRQPKPVSPRGQLLAPAPDPQDLDWFCPFLLQLMLTFWTDGFE